MTIYLPSTAVDRDLRDAIAKGATTDQVRFARAIIDVHAVDISPYSGSRQRDVKLAVDVAAAIIDQGLVVSPSQIRRLYGNGATVHDLVNDTVAAVKAAR